MADAMLFQFIGDTVDRGLNIYVNSVSSSTVASFITLAISLTALYYVFLGLMLMLGKVENTFSTFLISAGKFIIISAFALSADMYLTWIVGAIHGLESGLTAAFSGSNGVSPTSVYGIVDNAFNQGMNLSSQLWEKSGSRDWDEITLALGDLFNSIIVLISTLIITIPTGAMILVAKTVLSIMLGIGPLFILLLMWPITKGFFDRWFSVVMTAIFQIALLSAVLSLAVKIFISFTAPLDSTNHEQTLFITSQLLVVSFIMAYVLKTVNTYAAQLAGGISSSAITLGQMAHRASGVAQTPGRTVSNLNNTVNPSSNRLDPETGLQTQSRRFEHIAMGRSIVSRNPKYRNALQDRLRKTWGKQGGSIKRQ